MFRNIGIVLLTSKLILSVTAIGRTLADCEDVAGLFDNTCDSRSTPINFSDHSGITMQCEDRTWKRKLCVTCSEEGTDVYIRVQSNSLPNHCYKVDGTNPVETETDWAVAFNGDMTGVDHYPEVDSSLNIGGCE